MKCCDSFLGRRGGDFMEEVGERKSEILETQQLLSSEAYLQKSKQL